MTWIWNQGVREWYCKGKLGSQTKPPKLSFQDFYLIFSGSWIRFICRFCALQSHQIYLHEVEEMIQRQQRAQERLAKEVWILEGENKKISGFQRRELKYIGLGSKWTQRDRREDLWLGSQLLKIILTINCNKRRICLKNPNVCFNLPFLSNYFDFELIFQNF